MLNRNYATRMSCFSLISSIEGDLRELIVGEISGGISECIPEDIQNNAKSRYLNDKKENFISENSLSELLDYVDFYDLSKILNKIKNVQTIFSLVELEYVTTSLERLTKCRNRVCHSRPLEPNDFNDLLDFTSGLMKTGKISNWVNLNKAMAHQYDPAFALALEIPNFWRQDKNTIYNNLPLPEFDDTGFMGRSNDRSSICKLLLSNTRVISIVGEGGVGKTALAQRCLYDILELCEEDERPKFEIIIWVSLKLNKLTSSGVVQIQRAISSSSGLFQNVSSVLGGGSDLDLRENLSEISEYMNEFCTILCIDNLETISGVEIRDFLANVPEKSKILITTRIGLGEIEYRYKLDKLDDKPSVDLMRNMSKLLNVKDIYKNKNESLRQLCIKLYNNPLLIKWYVMSVAAGKSSSELIDKSAESFQGALRFCFENLYDKLDEIELNVISVIACVRKPLSVVELRFYLNDYPEIKIEEALNKLHNSSMLTSANENLSDNGKMFSLTSVAEEFMNSVRPVSDAVYALVKSKRKELQHLISNDNEIKNHYKYDLNSISWSNRDEKICAMYLKKALFAARSKDLVQAELHIENAKTIMPEFSECYRVHGMILREQSPFKADREMAKAIDLNPKSGIARYAYAQFLLYEEDYDRAIEQIDAAIHLDPEDGALKTMKAWIFALSGKFKNAIELYEILLPQLDQTTLKKFRVSTYDQASKCYRKLAEQFILDQDFSSAKKYLGRAINIVEEAINTDDFDHGLIDRFCYILGQTESYFKKIGDNSLSIEILEILEANISRFDLKIAQSLRGGFDRNKSYMTHDIINRMTLLIENSALKRVGALGGRLLGVVINLVNKDNCVSYGFVKSEDLSYFFHRGELFPDDFLDSDGLDTEVTFKIGENEKGVCALDVKRHVQS